CGAVGVGSFTIARRTMETLGNDITNLPLTAAIVVAVVSSAIVVGLSAIGIPASFVIIATMSIVGLGWGRATRLITVQDAIRGRKSPNVSVGALTADERSPTVGDPELSARKDEMGRDGEVTTEIGSGDAEGVPQASELFDPSTTARVVLMQNVVPVFATVGAYAAMRVLDVLGVTAGHM
ncbi:MAG: inorganic phosphate transporter, partial [Natronomonas sp.]